MALFKSLQVGPCQLRNRIVMSAMTRLRNDPITEQPNDLVATYYEQRSNPGSLIVSEGMAPSPEGRGYIRAPNLYDPASIEAWKKVTERVHAKGAFIFAQLMHAGRVSHDSLLPPGEQIVAPSAVQMAGLCHTKSGKVPYSVPRALRKDELPRVAQDFATAAANAIKAGFDGVELHGGNGYLLQEFLAAKTNQRTDEYGGSVENRARFVLEVVDAVASNVGASKTAIKLQPGVTFSDLIEPEEDALAQLAYLGPELARRDLAYVCLSSLNGDPYYKFAGLQAPNFSQPPYAYFRERFAGRLMINGALFPEQADDYVKKGVADLASFGILYLANANLPELIEHKAELNMGGFNTQVWYSKDPASDAVGYTDWPLVQPPAAL
eukprot:jgi/Botrbrau1/3012/Bobra.0070s0010.1